MKHYLPSFPNDTEITPELAVLIRGFLGRLPKRIAEIVSAYEESDWATVQAYSHKLAGATLFGYRELGKLATAIESVMIEEDLLQARKLIAELKQMETAISESKELLEKFLEESIG